MTWPADVGTRARLGRSMRMEWQGRVFLVPCETTLLIKGRDDQPDAEIDYVIRDGMPEVRAIRISAKPDGRPLRDAHLRGLALDALAERAFLDSADEIEESADGTIRIVMPPPASAARNTAAKAITAQVRKAQHSPDLAELNLVREVYLRNIDGAPAAAVREVLKCSERTAYRRIKQAEEAGLLPATTPGKKRRS